jgi:hypothetical protein
MRISEQIERMIHRRKREIEREVDAMLRGGATISLPGRQIPGSNEIERSDGRWLTSEASRSAP